MMFAGEPIDNRLFSRDVPAGPAESGSAWARVSAVTTAFWQMHLGSDRRGREAYATSVRKQLAPKDRFEIG
jgi:hypothetical protein